MKKEKYIFLSKGYLLREVLYMMFLMEVIEKTDIKNLFCFVELLGSQKKKNQRVTH